MPRNKDSLNNNQSIEPIVSIVIPNYNGLVELKNCLVSVLQSSYSNFEIIIVDDASRDGSVKYIEEEFPGVKVLKHFKNKGPAAAYNTGIRSANGKYVAILNNDMEVEPNWLEILVEAMEKNERLAVVDAKYKDYFDRSRFDSVAGAGRFLDRFGNVYSRGVGERDVGQYDKKVLVPIGFAMFRKSILNKVGIFDEKFFYGYDEIDLCWRILLAGYEIMYVPSSIIYHKGGSTVYQDNTILKPSIYFHVKKNRLQTILKNNSLRSIIGIMPIIITEYVSYVLYWSIVGNRQFLFEIIRAIFWNIRNFRIIWQKHLVIQRLRRIDDKDLAKFMVNYAGDLRFILSLHR